MSGTLSDLNMKLFEQIDNLSKKDITDEELNREINKTEAIVKVANVIINSGELALKAVKFKDDMMDTNTKIPKMLEG